MLGYTRRHIWLQRGHTQKERREDVVGCAPVVVNVPPLLGVPELQQIRHLSHSTRKTQHALCVVKWEVSSSIRGGITKLNRLLLDISTHVLACEHVRAPLLWHRYGRDCIRLL